VYWLCYQTPDGVCVVIEPASALVYARLSVAMRELVEGDFCEGHYLEPKLARRIPQKMQSCALSQHEAQELLGRLDP
jgi:hypothetical protein